MRRLFRWVFSGLCLLSLLACVGTGWLWRRSYTAGVAVSRQWRLDARRQREASVYSGGGGVSVRWQTWTVGCNSVLGDGRVAWHWQGDRMPYAWTPPGSQSYWNRLGFGLLDEVRPWDHDLQPPDDPEETIATFQAGAPYWSVAAATALPPLLRLSAFGRRGWACRRRRRLGLCPRCGYDLRGNTSGKRSECGEKIEAGRRVSA